MTRAAFVRSPAPKAEQNVAEPVSMLGRERGSSAATAWARLRWRLLEDRLTSFQNLSCSPPVLLWRYFAQLADFFYLFFLRSFIHVSVYKLAVILTGGGRGRGGACGKDECVERGDSVEIPPPSMEVWGREEHVIR